MKKLLSFLMLFLLSIGALFAQDRTITGKVTDATDGTPLPGVSVIVKGTTTGTTSNANGDFQISAPSDATLTFSFIGFATQEVQVGGRTTVNVQMQTDVRQLNEVVVNAIGVETSKDKLGTTVSTVKGNNVVQSGETSLLNGLAGKATGVSITRNGSDPGAGTYIQLRGQNSITGSNQPLIVIDGIPIFNSYISSNDGNQAGSGNQTDGVQQQSRLNDLNPSDIASVEVLPSASAAALWGSRAANGVIVITTKKGQNSNGKINIGYKGTVSLDEVNKVPELQRDFGQGLNGKFSYNNARSWGDRIADRTGGNDTYNTGEGVPFVTFPDGTTRYAVAGGNNTNPHGGKNSKDTYDHGKEVFRTGYYVDNSINLSGGNNKASFFASYSNLTQKGIVKRNSDYNRNTARINVVTQLTDKVKATANVSYSNVRSNRTQQGSNLGGIFLGGLRTAPDYNNNYTTGTYQDAEGAIFPNQQISYRNPLGNVNNLSYFDNPLWTIDHNKSFTVVNRILGNIELSYDVLSWLNLRANVGVDTYTDRRTDFVNAQSAISIGGAYTEQTISESQWNANLFARANHKFSDNFTGALLLGFNYNSRQYNNVGATARNFIVPDAPPNLSNTSPSNRDPFNYANTVKTNAGFAQVDLEILNQVFVTATARAEAASTFGREAQSLFFYPSINSSWQFTKLLGDNHILSFGKIRAGFGIVGNEPPPYYNLTKYFPTSFTETWGGSLNGAQYGVGGYQRSATAGNPKLKPEKKKEVEVGFDLRFFNNKVQVSGTAYYNRNTDVILPVDLAPTSGFSSQYKNAATMENKGLEFSIQPEWVNKGGFIWSSNFLWSLYRNKVVDLSGVEYVFLPGGGFTDGSSVAVKGQPVGVIWGTYYARNENGGYQLDNNGYPTIALSSGVIGNPNPNYRASIGNTFSFKGLNLYALFDFSIGNQTWNGTRGALMNYGTAKATAIETTVSATEAAQIKTFDGATIANGIHPSNNRIIARQNSDGSYTFRGTVGDFGGGPVALDEAWYRNSGGGFGVNAPFVEDASWARLREITLNYTINTEGFRRKSKLSSITLGFTGRNLALWTDYNGIDPETNLTGANNGRGIDYFQNPNTRSFIFSLSINY
ncbi:SusC/RagA family TonB-linked outer membrane protein [Xanthocytophaga agilis]|uniref:SusC/RagA family TonB-linked outer membrane protein n=1 Tax=Xanthocytophaga agilis TaxID=3048010 RepID=A0AAE3R050_9BACT|nr:SusC/RagA family TonB-linked outer membrane protein [Xanthocytophaga agilis]MDJ1501311.1 SusC/RagA family TonB-linked outer membrane protein [Xanthocytophaga agilis]